MTDGNLLAVVERFLTSGVMAEICHHPQQAQEVPRGISLAFAGELGLLMSPEKTPMPTPGTGYDSLGFHRSSRSRCQRDTSAQKFKANVWAVTDCHRVGPYDPRRPQPSDSGDGPYLRRQVGLLTLEASCRSRDRLGQARCVIPRPGATSVGVARCETRTPVNMGN
jgi:hypothetical protein